MIAQNLCNKQIHCFTYSKKSSENKIVDIFFHDHGTLSMVKNIEWFSTYQQSKITGIIQFLKFESTICISFFTLQIKLHLLVIFSRSKPILCSMIGILCITILLASWLPVSLCQHGNKKNIAELEEKQVYISLLASFSFNTHLFIQLLNEDLSDFCRPSTVLGV